ncbi:glycine/betaine ABC transporter permease [Clostridia bacterium]|nr:glycine/betaine ABC transporter permease [Clostridia bacterium]
MYAIFAYFSNNMSNYTAAVGEHITISAIAVLVALVIGVPLGVAASKNRLVGGVITGAFSTLRIIPSLAVLLLCIPIFGVGVLPSVVALSFLAIPPVLINTVLAFTSLPAPAIETANAMGMKPLRVFWLVKLPLSLPFILAGVKTAVVEVISSATLAAYIGAGGLGAIIFTGIGLMRTDLLLIGGVSVAILSLLSGFLLGKLENSLTRWKRGAV